ncbi:MAG: hypothetical protein K8U03_16065 [Planctomycetia bacterium]|nr:hypothetical protein [Planctomycetia bacterium]
MPLKLSCPQCRKALTVPDQLAGRTGKCPGCGASVSIPPAAPVWTPPPPPPPAAAPEAILEGTLVDEAPSSRPPQGRTSTRPSASRKRSATFWLVVAGGGVVGLFVLTMLLDLVASAVHEARQTTAQGEAASNTALAQLGHSPHQCLVCKTGRSSSARRQFSDDHGFGFCDRCGAGRQAMTRMANNGGVGTPSDQQAVQQFTQTMQQHLGANPTDAQRGLYMSLMAFDSPEWNTLYGPVK